MIESPKILVGISAINNISTIFLKNFENTRREWRTNKYLFEVEFEDTQFLDVSRNNIVKNALLTKSDYIFFLDSDMILQENTLNRLLSHDEDIVTGIYYKKFSPYTPTIMRKVSDYGYNPIIDFDFGYLTEIDNNLIEIDAVGLGCILIKTEIFKRLKFPWFKITWIETNNEPKILSEDYYFCNLLKQNGYKLYADKSVQCKHFGTEITEEMFLRNKDRLIEMYSNLENKISELEKSTGLSKSELWNKVQIGK